MRLVTTKHVSRFPIGMASERDNPKIDELGRIMSTMNKKSLYSLASRTRFFKLDTKSKHMCLDVSYTHIFLTGQVQFYEFCLFMNFNKSSNF